MPLNDPDRLPYATRPRLRALADGVEIPGALSTSITSTNNYHADRFQMRFAPPPDQKGAGSWAWWASQTGLLIDIQIGEAPTGSADLTWKSILLGQVDTIEADRTGYQVNVDGRDLTARLIDNKIEAAYPNKTASEIVIELATAAGLQYRVAKTTTLVGRFYDAEHAYISQDQFSRPRPMWDLITMLARYEDFDAFVERDKLYFQPRTPPDATPYVVRHQIDPQGRQTGNAMSLQARRALTIAKGIKVVVKSWHSGQKRAFIRTSPGGRQSSVSEKPGQQQYVFIRPNLTEDQAQRLADHLRQEISQQERTIAGTLPGDTILTPRVMMRLDGTGTEFDRVYYPDQVTRIVDAEQGYVMDFTAKSLPPAAETTA